MKKLEDIAKRLIELTPQEASDLNEILKNDYGIELPFSDVQPLTMHVFEAVEEEQIEFDVVLKEIGGQKLQVVKLIKDITGLGLRESKELIDSAPCVVVKATSKINADDVKDRLESVGSVIEIK